MSKPVEIKAHEQGAIRVFAINRAPANVADTLKAMPKADLARDLIGNPHLNTASTEIFPVADLTGLGLGAYLIEGYAVLAEEIAPDRSKLDALDGFVMLLFSDSFAGTDVTLAPTEALTLIGTYTEYRPPGSAGKITTASAKPYSGTPSNQAIGSSSGGAGSALIVLVLAGVAAGVIWGILG